jgi:hypothetical protein
MAANFSENRRLFTSIALAAFVFLFIPLLLLWTAFWTHMPDSVRVICFVAMPPWLVMAVVLLSKLELDGGLTDAPKGELEHLLEQKRSGALRDGSRASWDRVVHSVQAARAAPKKPIAPELAHHVQAGLPAVKEPGDALDRLVSWKRQNEPTGDRDGE